MKTVPISRKSESGALLIEVIVAMVIFATGILAIIGLQSASIKLATDTRDRAGASLLANQLLAEMWSVAERDADGKIDTQSLANKFATGKPGYLLWKSKVQSTLPGGKTPTVVVTTAGGDKGRVVITLFWQPPGGELHKYVLVGYLR